MQKIMKRMKTFEYIIVSITTKCNMNCNGCFKIHSNINNLNPETFHEILQLSKNVGCKYINLSGGEPLLNPNWESYIRICYENDITPLLSTNGILISKLKNDVFYNLGVLAIPLDGPNPYINDRIRCNGHYVKIVDLINEYKNGNFPFILKVNTLVNKSNIYNLDPIGNDLLNDSRIVWKLFQASSRGKYNKYYEESISNSDFLSIVDKYINSDKLKCRVTYLCAEDAIDYLIVSPDGSVYFPDANQYSFIGSHNNPNILELIQNINSEGNTFRKLVLGEE